VTCQTVLIHMPDPAAVVGEWSRVGARVGSFWQPSPTICEFPRHGLAQFPRSVDEIIARVRLKLTCERGKAALAR